MRRAEVLCVDALVSHDEVYANPDALGRHEEEARARFVAGLRRDAHGTIWPSVVVERRRLRDAIRIRVSGRAFLFRGGNES